MEKLIFLDSERKRALSRDEVVDQYMSRRIDGETEADQRDNRVALEMMRQFKLPNRPLARHVVCIPVAAHQESARIAPAMAQYAAQQTDESFSVALSLNYPADAQSDSAIAATLQEVEMAKERYPHLDLRSAVTMYEQPTIGMIRRDLWNAALYLSVQEGAYMPQINEEVIGINHDIDVEHLSPRYIRRVQEYYARRQARYTANGLGHIISPAASTVVRHAPDAEFPNISKGMSWVDYCERRGNGAYEAGLVIPFSLYAQRGGFSATARTYETGRLWRGHPGSHRIPGATIETSPRRYIDRLRFGFDSVWTDESFGATDACRTGNRVADLSSGELEKLMRESQALDQYIVILGRHAIEKRLDSIGEMTALSSKDITTEVARAASQAVGSMAVFAQRGLGLEGWSEYLAGYLGDPANFKKVTGHILAEDDTPE